MPTETPRRYGKKSLFSINGLAIIGPKPEPKPLIINSKPIPAANSPKLVSMPIKISKKTCAPPPDAHIPLANTTLPIAGSLRIYFQPEIISLNADLGVSLPLTGLSGPPGGRVDINKIESKKVEQSIHKAVVIPNSEIVKPPIPAPIPNFKLFGMEFISHALIGVKDMILLSTPKVYHGINAFGLNVIKYISK